MWSFRKNLTRKLNISSSRYGSHVEERRQKKIPDNFHIVLANVRRVNWLCLALRRFLDLKTQHTHTHIHVLHACVHHWCLRRHKHFTFCSVTFCYTAHLEFFLHGCVHCFSPCYTDLIYQKWQRGIFIRATRVKISLFSERKKDRKKELLKRRVVQKDNNSGWCQSDDLEIASLLSA